jgi:hypothetical protein
MNHVEARNLAELLILDLHPGCARGEVAGSVRRGKPEPHDLEVVVIPKSSFVPMGNLFGEMSELECDHFEPAFVWLLQQAEWELDPVLKRDGPHYKRLRHVTSGMCADLFLTTERGWGGAMAIRTGPADFSRALVTLARRQGKHVADGYLIHGHPKPRRQISGFDDREEEYPCPEGESCPLIIPTLEEADFLSALGLPHWDPAARTAELVWKKAGMEAKG